MIQEEKELVIDDLCGRLPYGLIIKCNDGFRQAREKLVSIDIGNGLINYDWRLTDIKPYLRKMSTMTEEEESIFINKQGYDIYEWLDENMFDYRGLIPRELAFEAKEGMYNN